MSAEENLIAALRAMADKSWEDRQRPVLLSALPRLLETEVPEYREALAGRSFKAFVKATEQAGGYTLIEHPSIRAKVAVAPATANYQFPANEPATHTHRASTRQVTLDFLSALSELPEADQDKVAIPVSVVAKLLK
jgi:hypothetical protein